MKFKRLNNCFLSLFLLVLTSCQSHNEAIFKIGVSQCSKDLWRATANEEILREASFMRNMDVEIRSVEDNSEEQIKDIEYFINQNVDLIVVSPNEAESVTPVIEKAYDSGIPIILFDRKINSDSYNAYVGADNFQIGSQMGMYINSHFTHHTEIVILRGTKGSTADIDRYEGLLSAFSKYEDSGKYTILSEKYANFLESDAYNAMRQILRTVNQKDIDLVIALNDQMAKGASDAFKSTGSNYIPTIIGIDALSGNGGGIEMIDNGIIDASFIYPTGGDKVIEVADLILSGKPYYKENLLSTAAVDRDNVRVISLQRKQISDQQVKFDTINSLVANLDKQSAMQRQNLLYLLIATILGFSLAGVLMLFNRRNNKYNEDLHKQYLQIQQQMKELEIQKSQSIALAKQLEESTQAKLVFFTNISHEFKTPLSLIVRPVEELLKAKDLTLDQRDTLEIIQRNSNKLLALISEILDFRTYENGMMKVEYTNGNLNDFLDGINRFFPEQIKLKKLHFSYQPDSSDYNLPLDYSKIEKIYFNLLSNAFKYTPDSGTIQVGLMRDIGKDCNNIVISVYNSGSYIPSDKVEAIFKRFYKLDTGTNSTGIGLALTHSLVDAMGGIIKVESSIDSGTSFTVTIPVMESVEIVSSGDIQVNDRFQFTKMNILAVNKNEKPDEFIEETIVDGKPMVLVIEDNDDMRHFIRNTLKSDYSIITASNGTVGIKKAAQFIPSVIVCDIMMPGIDGYKVCETVKSNTKTKDIPFIFLTACSLEEQKARSFESGADAYIEKPFNARVLKIRIKKLIEKSSSISDALNNDWLTGKHIDNQAQSDLIGKIKNYVEDHIDENISIDDISAHLCLSKSKLYRSLAEFTDKTPVDLINLIRLRKAIGLMLYEKNNISEAAFKSGYSSVSFFTRTFSKYYKTSPSEWLKKNS